MNPGSDDSRLPVETQTALLRHDFAQLRHDLDALHEELREVARRPLLDERGVRELCRDVFKDESSGETGVRDSLMRIAAFVVSVATFAFVLRGGR